MVQVDPTKRPNMNEVVESFTKLKKGLSPSKLEVRLVKKSETRLETVAKDVSHNVCTYFRSLFHSGARQ
jgi:hypothetical protein